MDISTLSRNSVSILTSEDALTLENAKKLATDFKKKGVNKLEALKTVVEYKGQLDSSISAMFLQDSAVEKLKEKRNLLEEIMIAASEFFDGKLKVYQDTNFFLIDDNNVCSKISLEDVQFKLYEIATAISNRTLTHKEVVELTKTYLLSDRNRLKISELPPSFSTDKSTIAFKHIDLSIIADGPTPTWDFFGKVCGSNYRALQAFVWLVLNPQFESRQYTLMRSIGSTGKGTFTNYLEWLLGKTSCASATPTDSHWPAACVGKRLVFFNEVTNTSFLMSSAFKAITGNDAVTITQKFEKSYTARLDSRFIISTNSTIDLANRTSESSRCILVDMAPVKESDKIPNYAEKLRTESNHFLFQCKHAFEELYNAETKQIMADTSAFELHSESFESDFALLFQKVFKIETDAKLRSTMFTDAINQTSTAHDRFFKQNFKEWLLRMYPQVKMVKLHGVHYFKNIALKKTMETILSEKDYIDEK